MKPCASTPTSPIRRPSASKASSTSSSRSPATTCQPFPSSGRLWECACSASRRPRRSSPRPPPATSASPWTPPAPASSSSTRTSSPGAGQRAAQRRGLRRRELRHRHRRAPGRPHDHHHRSQPRTRDIRRPSGDHLREVLPRRRGALVEEGRCGLGLAIAREIVVAHHGDIEAASERGVTVFTLRIPTQGEEIEGAAAAPRIPGAPEGLQRPVAPRAAPAPRGRRACGQFPRRLPRRRAAGPPPVRIRSTPSANGRTRRAKVPLR